MSLEMVLGMVPYATRDEAERAVNRDMFGPGVHPRPIDNPPPQRMEWPCIRCSQTYATFDEYMKHVCSKPAPAVGLYKPKEGNK